jgi:hypothetical protein
MSTTIRAALTKINASVLLRRQYYPNIAWPHFWQFDDGTYLADADAAWSQRSGSPLFCERNVKCSIDFQGSRGSTRILYSSFIRSDFPFDRSGRLFAMEYSWVLDDPTI